ncbi:MAG: sporulation transcriptional regulator SpoIIID [Clostridia bacterium]|nr:sporulation transcriptional regulator SpoIIID [Clostridia bacterium]
MDSKERCEKLAEYIIAHRCTVRAAGQRYGVSKSTVHKDVTEKLRHVDPALAAEVEKILRINKEERHLRGGAATKEKYRRQSEATGSAGHAH